MNGSTYVDTSAFAKWYLNEARSDDVEAFIRARRSIAISRLTVVELRSLLARRRRNKEIDRRIERGVLETFEGDMRKGSSRFTHWRTGTPSRPMVSGRSS